MINFSVGPVQLDSQTLSIASTQPPYFRTKEFSAITKENEEMLLQLFDANKDSRVIFLTSSGTGAMELCVMNLFSESDKVLVVNGGSFGARFSRLCDIHNIAHDDISLGAGEPLTKEVLSRYDGGNYTGMLLQLCETSTGVLYDMELVGNFCKNHNIFLVVDAISGFLADEVSMIKNNIDALITGSQKALSLPAGMAFIALNKRAIARVNKSKQKSMYFDAKDYLLNGERGQTPFTPAVTTILMLNEKLKRIIKNGGALNQHKIIAERATYFRENIKNLPLSIFTNECCLSSCVTALKIDSNKTTLTAPDIFEALKSKYDIYICPNGGDLQNSVFRVGHIGSITKDEIDKLLFALKDIFNSNISKGG